MLLQGQMGDTYDGFINTREDLIESNMTLGQFMKYLKSCCNESLFTVLHPGGQWLIDEMRKSQLEEYNKLVDISLSIDGDGWYHKTDHLIENEVIRLGTHATAEVNQFNSHFAEKHDTVWYRSTETVMSEYPHNNWLSKKKWPLNEQLNLHMLNYQEV